MSLQATSSWPANPSPRTVRTHGSFLLAAIVVVLIAVALSLLVFTLRRRTRIR
jgi:nitric oxide reductase large subunit